MTTQFSAEDFKHAEGVIATSAEEHQARVDLAAMFRLTAMFGWDDTVWNHITARVPGSDHTSLCTGLACCMKK